MAEAVRPEKKRKKAKKIDKASPKIQRHSPSTKWFVEDAAKEGVNGKVKAFILLIFVMRGRRKLLVFLETWPKICSHSTVTVRNCLHNFVSFASISLGFRLNLKFRYVNSP